MNNLIIKGMGLYVNTLAAIAPQKAGQKGFELFCTPMAPKIQPHQMAFLDTAEQAKFTFKNKNVQTYKWGDGPKKVLFLHGWQSHAFRWKKYIELLDPQQFTIYAMDGPAHGQSDGKVFNIPMYKELINQWIDEVAKPDVVVGHSMGGFSSMYAFYSRQDQAPEKLIVMGSPGMASDFVDYFEDLLGLSKKARESMLSYFKAKLGHGPEFYSAADFAKAQTSNGLLIHDVGDKEVPVKYAREMHANWPNSQYWETTGYGHKLRDMQVVKRVVQFIENN